MSTAYHEIVSAVQVAYYIPSLGFAIFLALRHGFLKSAGWYYLFIFTVLRTVGGVAEIVAIRGGSTGAYTTAFICNSVGLAPLTLLCLGLLSRANDCSRHQLPSIMFKLISTVSFVGLVLGIIGGTGSNHEAGQPLVTNIKTKIAVIIFVAVYLSTIGILLILATRVSGIMSGEKRLLVAVSLAVPFIGIRLLYAVISDFSHLKSFNILTGSVTIHLFMAVIMEMIVTFIIIAFGMTLKRLPEDTQQNQDREMEAQSFRSDGQPYHRRAPMSSNEKRRAKGPISYLIYAGKDAMNNQQSGRR